MKCQYCGNQLPELPYAQFCPYCGRRPPAPVRRSLYARYRDEHRDMCQPYGLYCGFFDKPAIETAKHIHGLGGLTAKPITSCSDDIIETYHKI